MVAIFTIDEIFDEESPDKRMKEMVINVNNEVDSIKTRGNLARRIPFSMLEKAVCEAFAIFLVSESKYL